MALTPGSPGPELARLAPSELLVSEGKETEYRELETEFCLSLTALARSSFDSTGARRTDLRSVWCVSLTHLAVSRGQKCPRWVR